MIYLSPFTDVALSTFLYRCKDMCSIQSVLGNYAIHEVMIAHSNNFGPLNMELVKFLVGTFPEALSHHNQDGKIPLHCILATTSFEPCSYEALKLLIAAHPPSVR